MNFTQGSRVRFEATFTVGGKVVEPRWVTAKVRSAGKELSVNATELERVELGVYALELVVRDVGELVVRFDADTGEFSETRYEVLRAEAKVAPPRAPSSVPAKALQPPAAAVPRLAPPAQLERPAASKLELLGLQRVVTTEVEGHTHTLDSSSSGGRTSVDDGHDHVYARNADGSWLILDTAGHGHRVEY